MRTWLLRRPEYDHYEHLMKELEMEDTLGFKNFFADGAGYVLRASATTVTPDFKLEHQGGNDRSPEHNEHFCYKLD